MSDNKKISELTRVSSLTGAEIVPFAKDGSNGAVTTAKLKEYVQPDLSAISTALGGKVDKVTGKGLSANDYTDADKAKLTALPTNTQLTQDLASKLNASVWNDAHEQFSISDSYWSYENGKVVSDDVWKRTPKIPLNREAPIILKDVSQAGNAATCFFDVGGNFISAVKGSHGALVTIEPSAFPEDAVFVGISTRIEEDTTYTNGETVEARDGAVADAVMGSANVALIKEAEAAGAVYNSGTGFFELNGLTDITEAQMIAILEAGRFYPHYSNCTFRSTNIRTNLAGISVGSYPTGPCAFYASAIEVAVPGPDYGGGSLAYANCSNLHSINPGQRVLIYCTKPDMFENSKKLQNANFKIAGNFNLDIRWQPLISFASLQYLVDNAVNTSAITVTVHPDVYAKLTGDTTNSAAAALTEAEAAAWQAVMTAAEAKNIDFATV